MTEYLINISSFFKPSFLECKETLFEKRRSSGSFLGRFDLFVKKKESLTSTMSSVADLFQKKIIEWCSALNMPGFSIKVTVPDLGAPLFLDGEFSKEFEQVVCKAPDFNQYKLSLIDGKPCIIKGRRATLTTVEVRPSNLFFDAMGLKVTRPGSGDLFKIQGDHVAIRRLIEERARKGERLSVQAGWWWKKIYGSNAFSISYQEILDTLNSQHVYLSPHLNLEFYTKLKAAMIKDGMVEVPLGCLRNLGKTFTSQIGIKYNSQATYEFLQTEIAKPYLDCTFWELGSQVVRSEDCRIFIDDKNQLRSRKINDKDSFRLISMSGLRPTAEIACDWLSPRNKSLVYQSFRTALSAAEKGFVIFPAVGMGVWGGSSELYWPMFFEAVLESESMNQIEALLVSSGGRPRFLEILAEYKYHYRNDPIKKNKLDKIVYLGRKDVIHLAHRLKSTYPDKSVSLVNASDPDVTLGNHVTEYMNDMSACPTTEENYGAMSTSCLGFPLLTLADDPKKGRIHMISN